MLTIETVINSFNNIRYNFIKELNKYPEFKDYTPNEISIILALANNPNIKTASDLCVTLSVSKGLISRSVDSLIDKKIIVTTKHILDKRMTYLSLNSTAEQIVKDMMNKMDEINKEIRNELEYSELELVDKVFKKITNYFEDKERSI